MGLAGSALEEGLGHSLEVFEPLAKDRNSRWAWDANLRNWMLRKFLAPVAAALACGHDTGRKCW